MTESRTEITIHVDGREVPAVAGEPIIAAAERAGTFIPRFCYHPRMEPVGVCRMCLVEVDGPRGATLQPACYVRVADGMSVCTNSDKVKKAQDGVLEFLLANHPLDCPVCDKGGECPLQDQTLRHGSGETRFIEEKRHFAKPLPIGELVLLDRERCIQCSRCTRFAAEIAGDAAIDFAGRGDLIEVATFPTVPFDSVFSGNTVQICPVGALTAKPYRFAARPWDLEQVESTCTTCAVGCRVAVQSSGNRLTRLLGVDSDPVNQSWLCDKGRFAIEAIDAEDGDGALTNPATRLGAPLVRRGTELVPTSWGDALATAARILTDARGANGVGAIGGAALTNEGAYAWSRFFREVLATDDVDCQYGDGLDGTLVTALPRATIDEAAHARVVLSLTGDPREELPVLFLRLRAAVVAGTTSIIELATAHSSLRGLASQSLVTRPGEAHLVARALVGDDAAYAQLATHPNGAGFTKDELAAARAALGDGAGVVVLAGRANAAESAAVTEAALATLAAAWPVATFLPTLRRANVFGALDMGLAPGLRAGRSSLAAQGRESGHAPARAGRHTIDQLLALASGEQSALVVLGSLSGNVPDAALVAPALARAKVIAVTGHGGEDLAHADVVLPVAVTHERTGTTTNLEGRVSSLVPKIVAPSGAWTDVAVAAELAELLGHSLELDSVEGAATHLEATTGYPAASVLAGHGDGVVVGREWSTTVRPPLDPIAVPGITSVEVVGPVPRAGAVTEPSATAAATVARTRLADVTVADVGSIALADAYSLRVVATRRLYDEGQAVRATPALRALVAAPTVSANPYDLDRLGVQTGDTVRAVTPRGSFDTTVTATPTVARGTVELVLASPGDPAGVFAIDATAIVNELRLESR